MKTRGIVPVTAELDAETNLALDRWAREEDRSKRRHLAVLARKLVKLRDTNADDLKRLGLLGTEMN